MCVFLSYCVFKDDNLKIYDFRIGEKVISKIDEIELKIL